MTLDAAKHRLHIRELLTGEILPLVGSLRMNVRDFAKASSLIETLLFRAPIHNIILREVRPDEYILLDGDWRLSVIKLFLEDGFLLEGMDYWPEWNGKTYSALPGAVRQRIGEARLRCVIFDFGVTDEMVARYVRQISQVRD